MTIELEELEKLIMSNEELVNFVSKIKSLDKSKVTVIKSPLSKIPSWESFQEHRRRSLENKNDFYVKTFDDNALVASNEIGYTKEESYGMFSGLKEFIACIDYVFGSGYFSSVSPLFIQTVRTDSAIPAHYDEKEVFHWDCVGSARWNFWPYTGEDGRTQPERRLELGEPSMQLIVEAGDVIYLPYRIWHEVHSLTDERASITVFSWEEIVQL